MNDTIVSGAIYGLHAGDGYIRYIGLTTEVPTRRLTRHRWAARHETKLPVHRWMAKHGAENIEMTILEYHSDIPLEDLNKLEVKYIAAARAESMGLLNISDGGGGFAGYARTPEHTAKIVASRKASTKPNPLKGKPLSAEHRAKVAAGHVGRKLTPEQCDAMSRQRKGIPLSPKHKANVAAAIRARPVTDAMRAHAASLSHIRHHINKDVINPDCSFCVV